MPSKTLRKRKLRNNKRLQRELWNKKHRAKEDQE